METCQTVLVHCPGKNMELRFQSSRSRRPDLYRAPFIADHKAENGFLLAEFAKFSVQEKEKRPEMDSDGGEADIINGEGDDDDGCGTDHVNENEDDLEEDHGNEETNVGGFRGEVDDMGEGRIDGSLLYPLRPEAEDCAFYMKTGTCSFGLHCKFNHPLTRDKGVKLHKENAKDKDDSAAQQSLGECKYFQRIGGCKFGNSCKYDHKSAKPSPSPILALNSLGLPIRPDEKDCAYYMNNGSCKYGETCKFNHPDPLAFGALDPTSEHGNCESLTLLGVPRVAVTPWSPTAILNDSVPLVPLMIPPSLVFPSQNPEWNGYQASMHSSERATYPSAANVLNKPATPAKLHHHPPMQSEQLPQRPGQPECMYFLQTGDCKFKSFCKFHHPKNQIPKPPPCTYSDKGLPLRPDQTLCVHYSRYGICKFGPTCRYDHSSSPPSTTCGLEELPGCSGSETEQGDEAGGCGSGTNATIQESGR